MKKIQPIVFAGVLVLVLSASTFAKPGTISTTKTGTISTTTTGTISTTRTGTISTTVAGTISTTRTGVISSPTPSLSLASERNSFVELLFSIFGW